MKRRNVKNAGFSFAGALIFFIFIAITMQIAILVYDYIIERTDNIAMIALLILILIVILSTVCVVFDWIRRKITVARPTNKILEATERIAEGDFSTRLNIEHEYSNYNQYDLIMENLNKMASELEKTEVLRMDFISNVSHEIKTPLSVIQNYASLIQDENLDSETRKVHAKTLISASKRITDLITNILRLNKLENQEIQEKKEVFNLTESLSNVVLDFESLIEKKNIDLSCNFDDVIVNSNQSLLELVWNNLISNAIKFTENGGRVTVQLKKRESDVEVRVTDSGCGINSEDGKRIFEKFYQADQSRSVEGNGLGLALVKKVVDVLGGEIFVESEIGVGSTFAIILKGVVDEATLD